MRMVITASERRCSDIRLGITVSERDCFDGMLNLKCL